MPRFLHPRIFRWLGIGLGVVLTACSMSITTNGIYIGPGNDPRNKPLAGAKPPKPPPPAQPAQPYHPPAAVAKRPPAPAPETTPAVVTNRPVAEPVDTRPAVVNAVASAETIQKLIDSLQGKPLFWVALTGRDENPGTVTEPFATVRRARDEVRKLIAAGLTADVTVVIRGGFYPLPETLMFGPEDSGTADHSITYVGCPDEITVLSGGRRITNWRRNGLHLWQADLPEVKSGQWNFRQLFVNDQSATRARTPNVSQANPFFTIKGASLTNDIYTIRLLPDQVKPVAGQPAAELVVIGQWEITRKLVESVEPASGTLYLAGPHVNGQPTIKPATGSRCFIENARPLLDEPGEWYLDRAAGQLFYWPRAKQDMTRAEAVAPVLTRILEINGTPEHPVRNLHFQSLQFSHNTWELPPMGYNGNQAGIYCTKDYPTGFNRMDESIRWEYADSCTIENSRITQTGNVGLALRRGCANNLVQGCQMFNIAANGLMVGDSGNPSNDVVRFNRIINNDIHDCGTEYYGSIGLWVGLTDSTLLSHNFVHDLPYTGISVGWRWDTTATTCRSNVVEFNKVDHVMQRLGDGGGIYTLGFQPGTVIRGNVIQYSNAMGLYLDQGSSGFLIESNYVNNCRTKLYFNSDRSSQTMSGNFIDFPLITQGKFGNAFQGDGASSCVIVPNQAELDPAEFTLEAWIKIIRFPETQSYIAGKNGNNCTAGHYGLFIQGSSVSGVLNVGGGCSTNLFHATSPPGVLGLNRWQHVALTYDGKTLNLFVNGSLNTSTPVNKTRTRGTGPFTIGFRSDKFLYLNGAVDEVQLYRRALTEAEVEQHAKATASLATVEAEAGRAGYWGFDEYSERPAGLDDVIQNAGLLPETKKDNLPR